MSLPKVLAEHRTVTIDGIDFDIRGLTGAEAARCNQMVNQKKTLAELSVEIISCGTDTSKEETKEWYEATPYHVAEQLIDAIRDLSRIDEGAQKSSREGHSSGGG